MGARSPSRKAVWGVLRNQMGGSGGIIGCATLKAKRGHKETKRGVQARGGGVKTRANSRQQIYENDVNLMKVCMYSEE